MTRVYESEGSSMSYIWAECMCGCLEPKSLRRCCTGVFITWEPYTEYYSKRPKTTSGGKVAISSPLDASASGNGNNATTTTILSSYVYRDDDVHSHWVSGDGGRLLSE